jgi:hypothetical protein
MGRMRAEISENNLCPSLEIFFELAQVCLCMAGSDKVVVLISNNTPVDGPEGCLRILFAAALRAE